MTMTTTPETKHGLLTDKLSILPEVQIMGSVTDIDHHCLSNSHTTIDQLALSENTPGVESHVTSWEAPAPDFTQAFTAGYMACLSDNAQMFPAGFDAFCGSASYDPSCYVPGDIGFSSTSSESFGSIPDARLNFSFASSESLGSTPDDSLDMSSVSYDNAPSSSNNICFIDLTQEDNMSICESSARLSQKLSTTPPASDRRCRRPKRPKPTAKRQRARFKTMGMVHQVRLDGSVLTWRPTGQGCEGVWVTEGGDEEWEWGHLALLLADLEVDITPSFSPVTYKAMWDDYLDEFRGKDPLEELKLEIGSEEICNILDGGNTTVDNILLRYRFRVSN